MQWQRRSVCTSVEAYPNIHYVAYACIEQTVLISHHQNVQTLCTKPIGERGAGSISGLVMLQHIWHLGVEMDSCCSPDSVPAAVDSAWVLVLLSKMGLILKSYYLFHFGHLCQMHHNVLKVLLGSSLPWFAFLIILLLASTAISTFLLWL